MDWVQYNNLLIIAENIKKQKEQKWFKYLDRSIYVLLFAVVITFYVR